MYYREGYGSKWARRITSQNRNLKLILTGSSSKLLSKEIATELRGRALSFTVFPLSFKEYLAASGEKTDYNARKLLYSQAKIRLKKTFNKYLLSGGFPAVLQSPEPKELLREYYQVMFYRDIAERHKVINLKLLEDYLTLLIDQTASPSSISSTANKLKEFGHSFSKNTLSNFSRYAQEAFLIYELKKFSFKVKEQLRAPKKIYPIDHGLAQAIRFAFSEDRGRLLETIAFLELKRRQKDVYYFQGSKECDFIAVENNRVRQAIQVCRSLENVKTKDRELGGLLEALRQYNLPGGLILTEDQFDSIKVSGKNIEVSPLWHWLLSA